MKLCNTSDNPELIQQFVGYCKIKITKSKISCLPWDADWYEQILDDIKTKPVYFVYDYKKKRVVTIMTSLLRFGTTIWKADTNPKDAAIALQEKYPEGFFLSGDSYELSKTSLYETECHASHDKKFSYPLISHVGAWTNTPEKVTELRDWLEDKYLTPPANWQDKIVFHWGNHQMFAEKLYDVELLDYPWQHDSFGHYSFIGMHYTNWEHNTDHVYYLLATVEDKVVGCICVFKYDDHRYGPKHYGMSYIDVATPYKNQGLAKKMIHELPKHLSNDRPLLLSRESREGAKCHMHECFRREQWPHSVMNQDEFDDFCRQQYACNI